MAYSWWWSWAWLPTCRCWWTSLSGPVRPLWWAAAWSRASSPVLRRADTGITGAPSISGRRWRSISIPRFSTTSIMFSATTTGLPSSSSWRVRYKLRSSTEASITLMMTSTSSLKINCRETISSMV